MGTQEFFGRDFYVDSNVLIPRPDTECLVEKALVEVAKRPGEIDVIDFGAGSGAIVLSILAECPSAKGVAVDLSRAALEVVRRNAIELSVQDRLTCIESDWASDVQGTFDALDGHVRQSASVWCQIERAYLIAGVDD